MHTTSIRHLESLSYLGCRRRVRLTTLLFPFKILYLSNLVFALLNSGATENHCLDRGFNFTDFTFLQPISTAVYQQPELCNIRADAWCPGRGAFSRGYRAGGLHSHREVGLLLNITLLSQVCCDGQQNLCGDLS